MLFALLAMIQEAITDSDYCHLAVIDVFQIQLLTVISSELGHLLYFRDKNQDDT